MSRKEAIEEIISRILAGERNLDYVKRSTCKKYHISQMIKNPEILALFPQSKLTSKLKGFLLKKPTRTLSGVTPIAVMIQPKDSCKWGCVYCPYTGLAAKSYTGFEPASLRGRQFAFDPYMQTTSRIEQFEGGGHPADKCEIIVMGGTFLEMNQEYKDGFIKGIYDGLNGSKSASIEEAIRKNEKATHRAIGLSIETRPDVCIPYIPQILGYGATRVELGVQNPDDRIYELINRGHTVNDVVDSTKELKKAAFKVLYHLMPGLPGSDMKKDLSALKKLFTDKRFRPDMLKIYPTLVIGGTVLKQWVDAGKYTPYTTEEAAELISEFYRYIPKYARVMRIQRDIPATRIEAGVKKSNLRELVEQKIKEKNIHPNEIRYREVGQQKGKKELTDFKIERCDYEASGSKEVFLSYENAEGLIAGFIRLRLAEEAQVRELHVYGSEVPLEGLGNVQHRGLGANLLAEAERVSNEQGRSRISIISGVGVREYYRRHGYALEGPYMVKSL